MTIIIIMMMIIMTAITIDYLPLKIYDKSQ